MVRIPRGLRTAGDTHARISVPVGRVLRTTTWRGVFNAQAYMIRGTAPLSRAYPRVESGHAASPHARRTRTDPAGSASALGPTDA